MKPVFKDEIYDWFATNGDHCIEGMIPDILWERLSLAKKVLVSLQKEVEEYFKQHGGVL